MLHSNKIMYQLNEISVLQFTFSIIWYVILYICNKTHFVLLASLKMTKFGRNMLPI